MVEDAVPLGSLARALVIKLRHHGDVLLASPVFSVLKNHAPRIEIDALVYADTAPMLTLHPAIAQVHVIERGWKRLGPLAQARAELALLARLRARRYDLIVHLTEHRRGAWLTRLLRPRYAVAMRRPDGGRLWHGSFTHFYAQPRGTPRHVVERNLDALRRIGIRPGPDRRLVLVPGADAFERVNSLLDGHGLQTGRFVHLHPASRWLYKCWPAEYNAALIDHLHGAGWPVVITAAPDARERRMIDDILARTAAPAIDLAGTLSLKELAALTGRAKVFVGVDSAPMHMAAAMGTPVVALFGPTTEIDWAPWQVACTLLASRDHPCRPCGIDGCGGGKRSECLDALPVARVAEAVQTMLGR
jgi:heptosyltransferase-3